MRHRHIHIHDASEASVTWKQFLRKLETGEWVYGGTPTPGQSIYYVTQGTKKKGVHNFIGRTMMISIMMTPEEAKAAKEEEEAKQVAYYRSLRERQKKNTDGRFYANYIVPPKERKEKIASLKRRIEYAKAGLEHSSRARAMSYREEIRELKAEIEELETMAT